jgi:hypothetical protein
LQTSSEAGKKKVKAYIKRDTIVQVNCNKLKGLGTYRERQRDELGFKVYFVYIGEEEKGFEWSPQVLWIFMNCVRNYLYRGRPTNKT